MMMPWVRHAIRWMFFIAATTGWINGAVIANQAALHYRSGTVALAVQSNRVEDPIVDSNDTSGTVRFSCALSDPLQVAKGQRDAVLPFSLENNRTTDITLQASSRVDTAHPVDNARIYRDTNGNGMWDSSDSTIGTVTVGAGESMRLFFVADIPANASWSTSRNGMRLRDNGTVPVTEYTALCTYAIDQDVIGPDQRLKLTKTAQYASHQLYKGSVVDYTIRIEALSDQPVQSAVFVDAIPSGTSFVPGSVTLDGQAKDDANVFDGSAIRIALPDMTRGDVHTVKFRVRVNK